MTLECYVKEYIAVTDYLKKLDACFISGNRCCVKKDRLAELLDKNAYDTVHNKLTVWKGLRWIDTDRDRFSKNVYDRQKHSKQRCIAINLDVYEMLKNIGGNGWGKTEL